MHRPRRITRHAALLAGYAVVAAADTALAGRDSQAALRSRRVTKPLLMPLLALSRCADAGGARRTSTLLAQVGSWGGDLALMSSRGSMFVTGMGCFAAAHASYIIGLRSVGARPGPEHLSSRLLAGLAAAGVPLMAIGAGREDRALAPAVAVYASILSTMAAHALVDPGRRRGRLLTAAGGMTFLASDGTLGIGRFWSAHWTPAAKARAERTVMATYTLSQALLSEGSRLS